MLRCSAEIDSIKRLACFDEIAATLQAAADAALKQQLPAVKSQGKWESHISKSPVDDTPSVTLRALATEDIVLKHDRRYRPALHLRCYENSTSMVISFGGAFMSDNGGNGRVTFRVDQQKAFERNLQGSTNNEALGLWSGGTSIPVIKSLFSGEKLLIRAVPYSESPVTVEFDIAGLEEAIAPLRTACNW